MLEKHQVLQKQEEFCQAVAGNFNSTSFLLEYIIGWYRWMFAQHNYV